MMMSNDQERIEGEIDKNYLPMPMLSRMEVRTGQVLGNGNFCKVSSVKTVTLNSTSLLLDDIRQEEARTKLEFWFLSSLDKKTASLEIFGKQDNSATDPMVRPPPCLAIKELKNVQSKEHLTRAKEDLKRELDILKKISGDPHPNVIELHAYGLEEIGSTSSFLMLSKIRATLDNFLYKWRERRGVGFFELLGIGVKGSQNLWLERIIVCLRIADAIRFLHSNKIIFRDLKPDNIGFDADDVPKIFDFGLAKQLDDRLNGDYEDCAHDTFQLTGQTGTYRYMPPEVAKDQPYGMSADVYSLSILMHEILSLKVPFAAIPPSQFSQAVFHLGTRPSIDPGWPAPLQLLLQSMWSATTKKGHPPNMYAAPCLIY